jgi:hypothetical protein
MYIYFDTFYYKMYGIMPLTHTRKVIIFTILDCNKYMYIHTHWIPPPAIWFKTNSKGTWYVQSPSRMVKLLVMESFVTHKELILRLLVQIVGCVHL